MSAYAGAFKNTICDPSGETDADQPSSLNLRGLPPRIERVQSSILLDGGVVHDTNSRELSGNHPRNVTSRSFGKIECISPVAIRRRKVPDLSEYARYFPSGEIADAETAFSVAFVVNRCNVGVVRTPPLRARLLATWSSCLPEGACCLHGVLSM